MMNCLTYACIQGLTFPGKVIWCFSKNPSKNAHINRHGMFTVMSSRSTRPENITFSRIELTEAVFKSFVEKNNSKEYND